MALGNGDADMGLLDRSAADMAAGIRAGDFRAVDLIEASLRRAEVVQERCNAFTCIDHDGALTAAAVVDRNQAAGRSSPLAGVPVIIKDMTPTAGLPTTLGSWTTGDGRTDEDALIVSRLRSSGAIVVAKSTTSEFAFSSFTRSLRYGATRNPWRPDRATGGSSGGSAVAVAPRVAPFAEGPDMGGSIRSPAGACGTVGVKPSLGRIPMTILPTPIDTMSHFGPLARDVASATAFIHVTAGPSDLDLLSQVTPFDAAACGAARLAGLRFAVSMDLGYCAVSAIVRDSVEGALEALRSAGAEVVPVDIAWTRAAMDQWLRKWGAFLSLFPTGHGVENHERMDPALVDLIAGAERLTAGDLKRTELLQTDMARDMAAVFATFDALLCPTNAITAPMLDATDAEFEATLPGGRMRAFDMTHPFSLLASYPALSLPIGLASDGLPVGLQVIGPRYRDERLLSIAAGMEAAIGRMHAASLA